MKLEYIPLDDVLPATRNPKDHDIGAIIESIRRFGFVSPCLRNDTTGTLVAGHGRLEALRRLWEENGDAPSGIKALKDGTWKIPVVTGLAFADDDEAEAYLIADNRLTEIGGWDESQLLEMLRDLGSHDIDLLAVTGYDADDIQRIADRLAGEFEPPPDDDAGGTGSGVTTCPKCGHTWGGV